MRTHRSNLWERLHQFNPLCVDLDEGQQIPGLNRLKQVDHFSRRGRTRLPSILVVHILSVDELLPHSPVAEKRNSAVWIFTRDGCQAALCPERTYMSLDGVGFGEGEVRFPSMISLKLLLPTFLASWWRTKRKSALHPIHSIWMLPEADEHMASGSLRVLLSAAFPLLFHYF